MPTGEEDMPSRRAGRLDVGLQLVPVGRVGEHHAGDKRAQCGRQAEQFHQRCAGDDREQGGKDEHLALAQVADQAEQRPQDEPPGEHQPDDGANRVEGQHPARRPADVRGVAAHRGDDGDQRHDREVLEQQDREGALAERGAKPPGRLEQRQDLRRGGKRQRQAERQRRGAGRAGRDPDQGRDGEAAQYDLRQAENEDVVPHPPQPRRVQLQPDEEEQQHDAKLGDGEDALRIRHQLEHMRADQRASDEITQSGAQPEPAEQEDEDEREAEQRHRRDQQRADAMGALAQRAAIRFEASAAASATASNGSRIAPCRAG